MPLITLPAGAFVLLDHAYGGIATGVAIAGYIQKGFKTLRDKNANRLPQHRDLDLAKSKAFYIIRSIDSVRIPINLEDINRAASSRMALTTRVGASNLDPSQLSVVAPNPVLQDQVDEEVDEIQGTELEESSGRFLRSRHLFAYRGVVNTLRPHISSPHIRWLRRSRNRDDSDIASRYLSRQRQSQRRARVQQRQESRASRSGLFSRNPSLQWWQRDHVYNVLDDQDNLLYTFERFKKGVWMMYAYPARQLLVTIRFKKSSSWWKASSSTADTLEFHDPGESYTGMSRETATMDTRKTRRKSSYLDSYNVFYTTDGAPYQWSESSRRLDRVVNWRGKENESRETLSQAKPMHRGQNYFEFLIDYTKIDPVVALATGFISMKTIWENRNCPPAQNKTILPDSEIP
ncbi:uncharacterized protein V1516DRAFT_667350 [Lipomyces oligophaga]|uniref:uncharacterized protein n=1 Tax=Lipomyces oligophaga TaxID=45792 RepID=UPI0034CDEBB3